MEWIGKKLRTSARTAAFLVCALAAFAHAAPVVQAATAQWATSILDSWYYINATSPGTRALAPTFLGGVSIDETTQQFEPNTLTDPARLGSALFAFNTSTWVTPGLAANQYQIESVTFTATWTYDSDPKRLQYEDTPVTQQQILSEVASGNATNRKPLELYGVGLRAGYTGYEFSGAAPGPPLLDESTHPYTAGDGGYIAFPVVGSGTVPGAYVDVSNSVTGGYSATAPANTTVPFTPTPWAIGKANLSSGDEIPDNTTFTFALDLSQPGVRPYIQQSLATGALGFFLSSLNSTGEFGSGGGYPRWYTKEAAGFPYFVPAGRLPQLTIDYSILPAGIAGDYNDDGVVNAADYVLWRKGGPLQNQMDDPDHITPQDYVEWRARYGNTSGIGAGGGLGIQRVPEPSTIVLFLCAALLFAGYKHGRPQP
jgi:hypothetical protein